MFEIKTGYTPMGAKQGIMVKKIAIKENREARIKFMRAKKDSHPSYMKLTDKEFIEKKREFLHWSLEKEEMLKKEIEELEKYL